MVLSSWPKPLREFTRFIWCMQTECRGGRQSPYQANRLGLWVWHVLLKCWIQTRRTRACRRIRRRKTTTTRMECWRPIWTRTSWFSRTMLSMSATSFYEFTIQQTNCRPVLTERSGSVCQLLCVLGLHYPHRYHTIVIDPYYPTAGFWSPSSHMVSDEPDEVKWFSLNHLRVIVASDRPRTTLSIRSR